MTLDATSLFLLMLAQMTASGLRIVFTIDAGSRYFCDRFFRASCSKNQQKSRDR
jgi:hypothetical protein